MGFGQSSENPFSHTNSYRKSQGQNLELRAWQTPKALKTWDIGKYSPLQHSHILSILRKRKQIQREKQYGEFLVWFSSQREERTLVALTGWLSVTTVLRTRPFLEGMQHSYRHKRALLCLPRHASYGWCLHNYQTGQTCDCSVYRGGSLVSL